eukprot:NODE_183_length_13752_cov_1.079103.p6 type:complete len:233 gc:universal NODE_183_length_13752_cov_1.079103:1460-2158(+)
MTREENRRLFRAMYDKTKSAYHNQVHDIKYTYPDSNLKLQPRFNSSIPTLIPTLNDCIEDIFTYQSGQTLLINSASSFKMGGGVVNGSTAQEEHLCRWSNLYHFLESSHQNQPWPLRHRVSSIYCKNVHFYHPKNESEMDVNVVSLFSSKFATNPNTFALHYNIFKHLVYWINQCHIQTVILVPVGCGVFKHDPQIVANALKSVLDEFECHCKTIYVSCYNNQNNFDCFSNE